jgi:hypothetical protein
MRIRVEKLVEIWVLNKISGPHVGWRSDVRRIAMFLATIEGQSGDSLFREWEVSSNGQ